MKIRFVILFVLVIILVSISWFRHLAAQDLESLLDKATLEKLRQQQQLQKAQDSERYRSPDIFVSDSQSAMPRPPSSAGHNEEATGEKRADRRRITSFDQLRPFGLELFDTPLDAIPPVDIGTADDYVLGPGDNLIIYLWGRVEREYNLTIDREGKIFVPRVGELIAWGLTLEQFAERAKKQFRRAYSDFDLTISLGKIRSIRIYVTGEVRRPGGYTVSSLTSLFNAIYIAGGPNERGSMRSIKLMRNGEPAAVIDLYNLMLHGDNSTDIRLRTGDVVFVPVAKRRVGIMGEVHRAAVYELVGEETALDLIALAGGATAEAHLDRIMLERISDRGEWQVIDVNLTADSSSAPDEIRLQDGDRLTVYSIFDVKTNMVAVYGKVKHPGYYERNDSTQLSDLIRQGRLQDYDVYLERADLFRHYPDYRVEVIPVNLREVLDGRGDLLLRDRDSVHVYGIDEIEPDEYVYIEGEVKRPGRYRLYDGLTVTDLIFLAGSFEHGAYAERVEIARLDSLGDVSVFFVTLGDGAGDRTLLQADDHLYVRRIPMWQVDRTVTISGEVMFPGKYTLSDRQETVYQLLQRAGGFTDNAFPGGLVFERQTIQSQLARQRVPNVIENSQPVIIDSLGNPRVDQLYQFDLQQMNRVIIDMERILSSDGRKGDLPLEPGDRIFVPSTPSGVSVMGAVGANGTIKYVPGRNVKYYIERAGNFTRRSDKKQVRLMRAGGEVISGRGTLGKKVDLGDVIIVPARIERDRNWLKTITTAVSATTGVLTSIYVVSRL